MAPSDTLDRERAGLWLVAAALFAAFGYVVYSYVGTVVLGLFIYYVARPVYDRIRLYLPSRTLAAMVALLVFILPVIVLFAWTLGLAVQELLAFTASRAFAEYLELLDPYVEAAILDTELDQLVERVLSGEFDLSQFDVGASLSGVVGTLTASLGTLGSVGLHLFLAGVIGFYLLRDDYRLVRWANRTLVPQESVAEAYVRAMDRDLKNVYFGNILNAFLTGVIAAITYTVLNGVAPPGLVIPAATLLGVLTGAASLVPVVGIKLTYVPVLVYLAVLAVLDDPAMLWFPVVFGLVSVVVVDVIPDLVLRPYVSGRTLHVGTLMVAYVFGPLLFGWYGIFLGPLILVAIVEFARIVVPWLLAPPGEKPEPLDPIAAELEREAAEADEPVDELADDAEGDDEAGDGAPAPTGADPPDDGGPSTDRSGSPDDGTGPPAGSDPDAAPED